jgi:hypothetical protein
VGSVAPEQWALGTLLFGAGQVLNMSVYKALGTFRDYLLRRKAGFNRVRNPAK